LYEIKSDATAVLNYESVGFEKFSKERIKKELKENKQKFGDAFHFVIQSFYPELTE
jgi:hypothetical protein